MDSQILTSFSNSKDEHGRRLVLLCKTYYPLMNPDTKNASLRKKTLLPMRMRSSSIVISKTNIIRPKGQCHPTCSYPPYFRPSKKLGFGLEMVVVVGSRNQLGKPIDVNEVADHIFGAVLMNDWSEKDRVGRTMGKYGSM